ncbi:acyltransferase [Streptomyces sp. DH12]|uniref:acyltransferase family protein n=1 Tax=Streptomyces sp. DH12 TaxID=2857010 RepID=UPI001E6020B0|nr:acyltransferase [Streptomyces sp. DH12]
MRSSDSDRVYLAPVDHLRAAAAVLVVLYHGCQLFTARLEGGGAFTAETGWLYSANPAATLVFEGHTAVALFMVLSGFIFTVGAHGRPIRYGRFVTNRLLRVYPLYLVVAVLGLATQVALVSYEDVLRLLTFATPGQPYGGVFWTLSVEVQFYLLFPLLNRLLTERGPGALLRLLGAVALLRVLVWLSSPVPEPPTTALYLGLAGRIDQFLLGMLAAWWYLRRRERAGVRWPAWAALGPAVLALWAYNQLHGFVSDSPLKLVWGTVEGAVWALFVAAYVTGAGPAGRPAPAEPAITADPVGPPEPADPAARGWRGRLSRGAARLGEVSYSVYLTHFMVLTVLGEYGGRALAALPLPPVWAAFALTAAVALPLTVGLSFLTYHAVELPFLKLRRPYLGAAPDGAAGAPRPRRRGADRGRGGVPERHG